MKLRRSSVFMKIVVMALIVYGAVMLANTRASITAAEQDRAALEERADQLRRDNLKLRYEIENASDPEVVANVARDRLGLVKPGEKVFFDIGN